MIHRNQDNLTLYTGHKFSCAWVEHKIKALAQWKESMCLRESSVKYKKLSPDIGNVQFTKHCTL